MFVDRTYENLFLDFKRINTNATQKIHTVKMNIEMDEVTTTDKWESRTQIPDRYKQVSADEVLDKIMNM